MSCFWRDAFLESERQIHTKDSDVKEHLDYFDACVKEAAQQHEPPVKVIELGVRYGVSTVQWISSCMSLGPDGGHLWAVDGAPPVEEPTMHFDLLNPLMDLKVWDFILGWDTEHRVLEQLPTDVDIVFIDTNHIYEETLIELELYYPRVRSGGKILLHDTAIEVTGNAAGRWQPPYPVRTAIEEFTQDLNLTWTNVENCCGLATIYVP